MPNERQIKAGELFSKLFAPNVPESLRNAAIATKIMYGRPAVDSTDSHEYRSTWFLEDAFAGLEDTERDRIVAEMTLVVIELLNQLYSYGVPSWRYALNLLKIAHVVLSYAGQGERATIKAKIVEVVTDDKFTKFGLRPKVRDFWLSIGQQTTKEEE